MVEIVESLKDLHNLSAAIRSSTSSAQTDAVDRQLLCPLSHKQFRVRLYHSACFVPMQVF